MSDHRFRVRADIIQSASGFPTPAVIAERFDDDGEWQRVKHLFFRFEEIPSLVEQLVALSEENERGFAERRQRRTR